MKTRQPLGIIDTISIGFLSTSRYLWLVLVPILADLFLWSGPQLSARPLFEMLAQTMATLPQTGQDAALAATTQELLTTLASRFNVLSLLIVSQLGIPSLLTNPTLAPELTNAPIVGGSDLMVLAVSLTIIGVFLASFWLTLVARAVRATGGDRSPQLWSPPHLLRRTLRHGLSFVLLGVLLALACVMAFVPLSIGVLVVAFFSTTLALVMRSVAIFILSWFFLWLIVHLYFVVEAVVLTNAGPLRALWHSFNIVGQNFWSALVFMFLVYLISRGMDVIWQEMATSPEGMLIAIVGHAYISTGLLASAFVFYADRYQQWQHTIKLAKERTRHPRP